METPSFKEDHISQIPALQLLQNMGYIYLTPKEVDELRGNKPSNVILENVLETQLRKQNNIEFRGQNYKFSNANISKAIQSLKDFSLKDGLVIANEKVYDTLTLGKSFEENIQGDIKSFTLHYIDWHNWGNNDFHVTEELSVEGVGKIDTYRPDLVLYVNVIPFGVIECKRPDLVTADGRKPVEQAISQHLRNQSIEDGIPQLFIYSQLLIACATSTMSPMEEKRRTSSFMDTAERFRTPSNVAVAAKGARYQVGKEYSAGCSHVIPLPSPPMFIDTHAHLYHKQFEHDREAMVQRAFDAGVKKLFLPNIDQESIASMDALAAVYPDHCFAMMGLHPCSVGEDNDAVMAEMERLLPTKRYCAVGEIGIDLYWDKTWLAQQQEVFRQHVRWAKELDLPIAIHCRNSFAETIAIVEEENTDGLRGVFHCFTGTPEEALYCTANRWVVLWPPG